jgi:hypothetical protein
VLVSRLYFTRYETVSMVEEKMKLKTTSAVYHQSASLQDLALGSVYNYPLWYPGGTTTCWGSTCTTSCAAISASAEARS